VDNSHRTPHIRSDTVTIVNEGIDQNSTTRFNTLLSRDRAIGIEGDHSYPWGRRHGAPSVDTEDGAERDYLGGGETTRCPPVEGSVARAFLDHTGGVVSLPV
jgi:hypothetical protein